MTLAKPFVCLFVCVIAHRTSVWETCRNLCNFYLFFVDTSGTVKFTFLVYSALFLFYCLFGFVSALLICICYVLLVIQVYPFALICPFATYFDSIIMHKMQTQISVYFFTAFYDLPTGDMEILKQ